MQLCLGGNNKITTLSIKCTPQIHKWPNPGSPSCGHCFIKSCLSSALENLMREHMYCELTEKKTPNQVPAHITFLSPTPTVTGKDIEAMTLSHQIS